MLMKPMVHYLAHRNLPQVPTLILIYQIMPRHPISLTYILIITHLLLGLPIGQDLVM
jgi:hypothetical protein